MEKIDIVLPEAWLKGFALSVSLSVSEAPALEAIADAFEHAYRDRGTDEASEEYISRKAEEYILKVFSDVLKDQVGANASLMIADKLQKNCVIRQRKDQPIEGAESIL